MFPKNAWYVAATPDEIEGRPLGRRICGEALVFWREADGRVAAVEDFCPHRGAPLSLGRVCDGRLVCGYHGLEMGGDGRTVAMPGQRVRGFPCLKRFAVREHGGYIWVWPGGAAQAEDTPRPRLPCRWPRPLIMPDVPLSMCRNAISRPRLLQDTSKRCIHALRNWCSAPMAAPCCFLPRCRLWRPPMPVWPNVCLFLCSCREKLRDIRCLTVSAAKSIRCSLPWPASGKGWMCQASR